MKQIGIAEWKRRINEARKGLTRRDIFMSDAYAEYSQGETDAMTAGIRRVINRNRYDDSPSGFTAYSSGGEITVNCGFHKIAELEDNEESMLLLTGMRAHECGHELFTDFEVMIKFLEAVDNNLIGIKKGRVETWKVAPEFEQDLINMIEDMEQKPVKAKVTVGLLKDLHNCFEDSYVNNGIYAKYPGEPSYGLHKLNDMLFKDKLSYSEIIRSIAKGERNFVVTAMNLLHVEAIGYPCRRGNAKFKGKTAQIDAAMQALFDKLKTQRERLPWENDPYERSRMVAEVMTQLYKSLVDIDLPPMPNQDGQGNPDQSQQGQSGSQQGQGSGSGNSQGKSSNGNNSGGNDSKDGKNNQQNGSNKSDSKNGAKSDGNNNSSNSQSGNSSGNGSNEQNGQSGQQGGNQGKDNSQSQNGNQSSRNQNPFGDRDLTDEEAKEIAKQILNSQGRTNISSSTNSAAISTEINKSRAEQSKKESGQESSQMSETQKRNYEKFANEVAKQIAEAQAEREHAQDLNDEAQEIVRKIVKDIPTLGRQAGILVRRPDVYSEQIARANEIIRQIEKNAKFLSRRLNNILKDRENDDYERGKYTGNKMFVKDAVKPGMRLFGRRNEPTGKPNIRICLLIDESGSMVYAYDEKSSKTRNQASKEIAMMLHKVLKDVGVEHCILGHTASGYSEFMTTINNYADFDTVDENDIYRIADIHARGGNADGAAISYCCEKLLKYPEKKVLIVISDGIPSVAGYFSNNAIKDTIMAVDKYTKKGVEIIGTTLISTNEKYELIYKNKLIDCSDYNVFCKTFIKLIQKYVLS